MERAAVDNLDHDMGRRHVAIRALGINTKLGPSLCAAIQSLTRLVSCHCFFCIVPELNRITSTALLALRKKKTPKGSLPQAPASAF